jgi:hypothetical protein
MRRDMRVVSATDVKQSLTRHLGLVKAVAQLLAAQLLDRAEFPRSTWRSEKLFKARAGFRRRIERGDKGVILLRAQ